MPVNWNYMARAMQRRPFFAKGSEEEIETALKIAAGIPTKEWCENMAKLEAENGDTEIGAGAIAHNHD